MLLRLLLIIVVVVSAVVAPNSPSQVMQTSRKGSAFGGQSFVHEGHFDSRVGQVGQIDLNL